MSGGAPPRKQCGIKLGHQWLAPYREFLALELGHSPVLELGYSPTLGLGRKRTLPPGNNLKPEVWHKNNKALIKAGNLKGLLGYPTCKLLECISAILKIEDEKIC